MNDQNHCLLISDFNPDNLAALLNNDSTAPQVTAEAAPFGQVIPALLAEGLECSSFTVVWTQPENVIGAFNEFLQGGDNNAEKILAEVDAYADLLVKAARRTRFLCHPAWVLLSHQRGMGMLDLRPGVGLAEMLMRMNLRLIEKTAVETNLFILDTNRWINKIGERSFNPKLWYLAKVPFSNDIFKLAVREIKAVLGGVLGLAKKIVIVDLDDTLWGGVVGEVGWENLKLGGHDHLGEAFADFQEGLKFLKNRGILLGIVSKNEESVACEAIEKHPEMRLRLNDFAGWKINWRDKAQNVAELASELNLGLQSVVFIDDHPVERARVKEALPEVLVPDLPDDQMLYKSFLLGLDCFDLPLISKEDADRTKLYAVRQAGERVRMGLASFDDWLKTLNLKVKVEELKKANLKRTVQLLNKTNQMNLSTRRLTENELIGWAGAPGRKLWTFSVSDKFGDSGLTGILGLEMERNFIRIIDFVLSCRVIGRKIEETMLYQAVEHARSAGAESVIAEYLPTPKNKPCLDFFRNSGFKDAGVNNMFAWEMRNAYPQPEYVEIIK